MARKPIVMEINALNYLIELMICVMIQKYVLLLSPVFRLVLFRKPLQHMTLPMSFYILMTLVFLLIFTISGNVYLREE